MIQIKKTILTLVALFAMTAGAWADEGTLLTTIVNTGDNASFKSGSKTFDNIATVTFSGNVYNQGNDWGWYSDSERTLTVTAAEGYTITRVKFYSDSGSAFDEEAPFEAILVLDNWETFAKVNGTSIGSYGITKIEVYGTAPAPAGTALTPDATRKVWTLEKMPGGNVTLEPEYYPQATLTAAPTAIDNVPATTDGAIVKAGTVKNIGETTTAQGTVMYYVSTTALDDAALLALAADQWTADVPTAESLAAGPAYVYYYVRGNDGDTDETTFSDGDILAANALTVTIAAAPTYAVTFADDLAEPTKWTASPNTGVTKGQTVTVTYTGSKKVLGVKAEKKAAAPAPITVTINQSDWGEGGYSFTKDGVTVSVGMIDRGSGNLMEGGTFSTTLGNFTKIVVTAASCHASGTGWSGGGSSQTWAGTPASSVSFGGEFSGMGMTQTTIVCTIEPTN